MVKISFSIGTKSFRIGESLFPFLMVILSFRSIDVRQFFTFGGDRLEKESGSDRKGYTSGKPGRKGRHCRFFVLMLCRSDSWRDRLERFLAFSPAVFARSCGVEARPQPNPHPSKVERGTCNVHFLSKHFALIACKIVYINYF